MTGNVIELRRPQPAAEQIVRIVVDELGEEELAVAGYHPMLTSSLQSEHLGCDVVARETDGPWVQGRLERIEVEEQPWKLDGPDRLAVRLTLTDRGWRRIVACNADAVIFTREDTP